MSRNTPSVEQKRAAFRRLHESGCFLLPNPWNAGSARYLQSLGFKALATTSAGYAWSVGCADNGVAREEVLAHFRAMVAATDLPINADFEHGFADDAAGVAEGVRLAIDTGIAGLSIEDASGDPRRPLYELAHAVERLRAARAVIDGSGSGVLLVARAEGLLLGAPPIDEIIARLEAYSAAGADCLYAPGLRTAQQISAVVGALAPKPVNVLVGWQSEFNLAQLAALGVRRVSVGGALARCAWAGFMHAARLLAEEGSFEGLAQAAPAAGLNQLFGTRA